MADVSVLALQQREVRIRGVLQDLRGAGGVGEHLQQPRSGRPQVTKRITRTEIS